MYHSITFYKDINSRSANKWNTWEDWGLIPSSRPIFAPAEPRYTFMEIPGTDGTLDLTDYFGQVIYADRTGSFEFVLPHAAYSWKGIYSKMANILQGKKMYAVLEDDPGYYYEGRFHISSWKSEDSYTTMELTYTADPFKYDVVASNEISGDWLWDPFNFYTGVITRAGTANLVISGSRTVQVQAEILGTTTVEVQLVSGSVTCAINGSSTVLKSGWNKIPTPVSKNTNIQFTGTGTVTLRYRGKSL